VARKVKYVQSVLCYLDILGFQSLIEEKSAGEISRILRVLAESVKPDIDPVFKGSSALSVQAGGGELDMFDTLRK
jgi:hypothetical protein